MLEKQSIYRGLKWKIGGVKAVGMDECMGSGSISAEAGMSAAVEYGVVLDDRWRGAISSRGKGLVGGLASVEEVLVTALVT